MKDFLEQMASSSAQRVRQAARSEPLGALERRAREAPRAPPLRLSDAGFDVIAELKLRSPAAGALENTGHDWLGRVGAYARAGAAAVSVLTEPSHFDGALEHLRQAAALLAPLGVPAMRKDFLVDPYQVIEARAAGAGGVLVILRMLRRESLAELLEAAAQHGLFVLLEAFDAHDLEVARGLLEGAPGSPEQAPRSQPRPPVLIGVNCRDLASLQVVPARFAELAPLLPAGAIGVAESGVASAADALRVRDLGYRLALIGTALMRCAEPAALVAEMLAAARTVPR
ncbi:MAG TPA: indole-3-glycerol phosphate synthase TrpC [Steroidobacteraceae bacterium]|nr:indole-3-glycerol phosphate synthase TrpC [Steroidobacteraceae bacterium]